MLSYGRVHSDKQLLDYLRGQIVQACIKLEDRSSNLWRVLIIRMFNTILWSFYDQSIHRFLKASFTDSNLDFGYIKSASTQAQTLVSYLCTCMYWHPGKEGKILLMPSRRCMISPGISWCSPIRILSLILLSFFYISQDWSCFAT